MKRRRFLRDIGLGGSGVIISEKLLAQQKSQGSFTYGQITSLEEAITNEGLINIRIELKSKIQATLSASKGKITISKGKINRIKEYFFEQGEDILNGGNYDISANHQNADIIALWIEDAKPETEIHIRDSKEKVEFTLGQLVGEQEISKEFESLSVKTNFLLDKEIAEITPQKFRANDPGDDFRLVVLADPQGGDPGEEGNHPTRMKIHNAWVEDSIKQTNLMNPDATLILGDIVDGQGQERNYIQMADFVKKVKSPILYAVGNHETKYKSMFTPGYNMEAFNNYFEAQKNINGLELMLYSFNMGKWHFIVWPNPLRPNFWETHPHYFDWLERDLEYHKNTPTLFFQHVPSHPIGINPLINYAESVDVKRTLLNTLATHGNVKYIFSGHVHIPIKSSFKTAVSYKNMRMINLPPAGYRPRAFGEEDYHGGPCQGILVLDFEKEKCKATFRTVMEEEYEYPDQLPRHDGETYKLWLNHKWELPAQDHIVNGDFTQNLSGWTPRFVYHEDINPSNKCESVVEDNKSALYLYSRKRGFDIPGQDRLPQTINRISQAVKLEQIGHPILNFMYKVDKVTDLKGWCGAYVWIEGFKGSFKLLNLIYSTGIAYAGLGGNYNQSEFTKNVHFALEDTPEVWNKVTLNLAKDHDSNYDLKYSALDLDKLVITLGVWTINDGADFPCGIYLSDFSLSTTNEMTHISNVNGQPIPIKPDEKTWWLGKYLPFTHVAGDHRYILGTKKMGPKG